MSNKGVPDCLRLGAVTKRGGGCMSVQISDCGRGEACVLQCKFHDSTDAAAILGGSIGVKGIGIRSVAHELRKHLSAPFERVFLFFKNQYTRSFTEDKPVPLAVPWSRGCSRVFVSRREGSHRGKASDRQWSNGRFAASADHHIRIAAVDGPKSFADGISASSTGRRKRNIGAFCSILNRNLPCSQVHNRSGDEKWRNTIWRLPLRLPRFPPAPS